MSKWGGRRAQAWTRAVLDLYGRTCALNLDGCTGFATEADHIVPRSVRLDLQYVVSNGRPACRHCNASRGDGDGQATTSPRFLRARPAPEGSPSSPSPGPEKNGAIVLRFERNSP